MPYCPKCGVEVEETAKACPLCNFAIPRVNEKDSDPDYLKEPPLKFPRPENIYPEKMIDFKRSTFNAITLMGLFNILGLILFQVYARQIILFLDYLIIVMISVWFFLLIFFGFIPNKRIMISAFILNSLFFSLLMDLFNLRLEWFFPVLLPSVVLASVILIITAVFIRYRKKKTINLIFPIAVALSACLCGIESIISRYITGKIVLSWSLFLSAQTLIFSLVLLFFYHRLASRIIKKLKMKLHM